jgi:hypothetical protein
MIALLFLMDVLASHYTVEAKDPTLVCLNYESMQVMELPEGHYAVFEKIGGKWCVVESGKR